MGKKKAIAEILNANLDNALSEKLYEKVYDYIKENDSLIFLNIMQYKFSTLLEYPLNDDREYKIMHYMMVKMQENYPSVLESLLQDLQRESIAHTPNN